jgi:hypothetical protein
MKRFPYHAAGFAFAGALPSSAEAASLRFLGHGGSPDGGSGSSSRESSDPYLVFGAEKPDAPMPRVDPDG